MSRPVLADGYPKPADDGLTKIWFASWADHDAFFASTNYRELVHPDEARSIARAGTGAVAGLRTSRLLRHPDLAFTAPRASGCPLAMSAGRRPG